MTKNEFISQLKEALQGMVPASQAEENIRYYENYFQEQKKNGKTESEISEELGNPRLIAKSIIEAAGEGQVYYDEEPKQQEDSYTRTRVYTVDSRKVKWGCAIAAVIFIAVLVAVFHMIAALFAFIGPVLAVVLIIYIIKEIMRR